MDCMCRTQTKKRRCDRTCAYCIFQPEDGIRHLVRSRGLGDVYKSQVLIVALQAVESDLARVLCFENAVVVASLTHLPAMLPVIDVHLGAAFRQAHHFEELILIGAYHVHVPVSYTHLRAHETVLDLVCRLLLEKQKIQTRQQTYTPSNITNNDN